MTTIQWWKVASILMALGVSIQEVSGQEPKPGGPPRADESAVVEVKTGKFSVTVVERGVLESSRVKDVLCQVGGQTTIIQLLPEGTMVKQGEVVCELDSAALRDQLVNQAIAIQQVEANYKDARLAREAAEIAVKEYVQGIYLQERATAMGEIALARNSIEAGRARLERVRRARKQLDDVLARKAEADRTPGDIVTDLTIDERLEAAVLSTQQYQFDLELAQTKLEVLEKYTKEKTIKQLSIDVDRKKAEELARQSAVELARSVQSKLERQIQSCKLVAPIDGLIILANDLSRGGPLMIEVGATVRERQKILTIIDVAAPMQVNAKVREALVDRVKPGLAARITIDAFPGKSFNGAVQTVSPLPDPTTRLSNVKVYTTKVKLTKGLLGLRPGMTAQAEILVTELDNVMTVPVTSAFRFDGKDHVAVKTPGGKIDWREVTLGLSSDKAFEVKKGLQAGDLVFLNPVAQMSDEMKRNVFGKPIEPAGGATRP